MGKGMLFIGMALFIDGLQAGLDWSFLATGGLITGATFGLGAIALPLGIVFGFAANFCLSVTFGVMLITGLGIFGLWDTTTIVAGGFFEIIPGLDCLPGWTLMTVRCVLKAKAKEESGALSTVVKVASAKNPLAVVKTATNDNTPRTNQNTQAPHERQESYATEARLPMNFKNSFDGISRKGPTAINNSGTIAQAA
jgi:hypothetical protein